MNTTDRIDLAKVLQGPGDRTGICIGCEARLYESEGDTCPHCIAEAEAEDRKKIIEVAEATQRASDLAEYMIKPSDKLRSLGVPAEYAAARMPKLSEAVLSWTGNPWSLFLVGPVGCGKTCAATAIFGRVAIQLGISSPVWVSVPILLHRLRQDVRGNGEDSRLDRILDAGLVLLDDLGAERSTPWALETIRVILMHCHQHQIPTLVTANAGEKDELEKRYPREISRLSAGLVVPMTGRDRRRKP